MFIQQSVYFETRIGTDLSVVILLAKIEAIILCNCNLSGVVQCSANAVCCPTKYGECVTWKIIVIVPINRLADKRSIWIRNDRVGVYWKLATVI